MYSSQHMPPPPPNYEMLQNPYGAPPAYYNPQQPYHQHRAIPRYQTRRSGFACCVRCMCCIYFLLFLLVFGLIASLFIVYLFYQPKIPYYKLEEFTVKTFSFNPDLTVKTDFLVTIRAENPNTKIEFIYGSDNSIIVSFDGQVLCSGKMPEFHQGHQNITTIMVSLTGKPELGSILRYDLENREGLGNIPLLVQVKVPVTFVFDTVPLRQFIFHVDCHVTVSGLRPEKKPRIISTYYTIGMGL
ncbi:hypothetical protein RND81_09G080100 [Saponaria officinalis]|uniref:Late embryogenesis abundant protein LEA-2 subgroup domain-containing protein n=1 Tax=Saponaria officinalis TaxID=3572 RepID=A0AAW1IK29_SAPOF